MKATVLRGQNRQAWEGQVRSLPNDPLRDGKIVPAIPKTPRHEGTLYRHSELFSSKATAPRGQGVQFCKPQVFRPAEYFFNGRDVHTRYFLRLALRKTDMIDVAIESESYA